VKACSAFPKDRNNPHRISATAAAAAAAAVATCITIVYMLVSVITSHYKREKRYTV
jgi:hypothetical protein